ncbi:hypothetical protein NE848_02615 [Gramella jeungdoensis]|uniref:Uncharacterized protein n=1 Tax=Gramella jeungdoensis TaxID=708091 RepID=A0ABT0YXQ0_9FLAO|nr:hypothetical protein [Gramella jeungdoensis]MCM8568252.1 hypothetical protein [Gramella jeungdoensis]
MKKIFALVAILLILFISLIYWSISSTDKEFETCTIESFEDLDKVDFREHDSVLVAANSLYEGDAIKKFMQGENYREAWSTPVQVPIVFLDTLKGGMKIVKEGGGKQTHSIRLKSDDGILYSLRSVTKDPQKLIPEIAETLGLENIIVDGISAQHPYGALLAAELSDIAGVLHTHPKLVFVPKQKIFGEFNDKYGNRLYLLEYETEGEKNWTSLNNIKEIIETDDLQELKLEYGEKLNIDRKALVRLRLFDIMIGDWDRHAEQWGWAIQEKNNKMTAIPIAGDRDNAFFNLSGVISEILTNKNIEPLVRPFEEEVDYMPGLVYPFDRYFLLKTPEEVFVEQAKELQTVMSDEKIDQAFHVWAEAISKLDKEEITSKIKNRRKHLQEYARNFYEIIQRKGKLSKPLKGSEELKLNNALLGCFECSSKDQS